MSRTVVAARYQACPNYSSDHRMRRAALLLAVRKGFALPEGGNLINLVLTGGEG